MEQRGSYVCVHVCVCACGCLCFVVRVFARVSVHWVRVRKFVLSKQNIDEHGSTVLSMKTLLATL